MKRDSKKIIQEAVKAAISGDVIISEGPITWAKSVGSGVKGAGQSVVGNFRANRAKSYMDQFAKKTQSTFDSFSSKAVKQAEKMKQSKNSAVAQTGEVIADEVANTKEKLTSLTQNIQKVFPTGVGPKAQGQQQAPGISQKGGDQEQAGSQEPQKADPVSDFKKWAASEYGVTDFSKIGVSVQKDLIDQYKQHKKDEMKKAGREIGLRKQLKDEPKDEPEVSLDKKDVSVLKKEPVSPQIDAGDTEKDIQVKSTETPKGSESTEKKTLGKPLNLKDIGLSKEEIGKIAGVVKSPEEMLDQPFEVSKFSQELQSALKSGKEQEARKAAKNLVQYMEKVVQMPPEKSTLGDIPARKTGSDIKPAVDQALGKATASNPTMASPTPVKEPGTRPQIVSPGGHGVDPTGKTSDIPLTRPQTLPGTNTRPQMVVPGKPGTEPIPLTKKKNNAGLPEQEQDKEPIMSMADFMARSSDDPEIARQAKQKIDSERELDRQKLSRKGKSTNKKKALIIDRDLNARKENNFVQPKDI